MHHRLYHVISVVAVLTLSILCSNCGEEATPTVKDCYRLLRVQRQDITLTRNFIVKMESLHSILLLLMPPKLRCPLLALHSPLPS